MSQDKPRWLLIRHSKNLHADRIEQWLSVKNIAFDICIPRLGDTLPPVGIHNRYVVYGGVPNVNTSLQERWMKKELRYIESALSGGIQGLGICLGAQMLAHALGARIYKPESGLREVGYHWIHPVAKDSHLINKPMKMLQWHSQGFDLPENSLHLARSDLFEHQAFLHTSQSIGLQFHPEVNPALLKEWQIRNSEQKSSWLTDNLKHQHQTQASSLGYSVNQWLSQFLVTWNNKALT